MTDKEEDRHGGLMLKNTFLFLIISITLPFIASSCAWMPFHDEPEETPYEQAVNSGQIVLGMPMTDVRQVWGEPLDVESAGDPRAGNERWVYSEGLSSRWSLAPTRVVYFERGRVIGWKTSSR
jgi:hypothetical protein